MAWCVSSSLTLCVQFWRHGITTTLVSAAYAVRFYLNASIMSISYYLCVIFGILSNELNEKNFISLFVECRKQDWTSFDRWLFEWVSIQMRHDHVKLVLQPIRNHKLFIVFLYENLYWFGRMVDGFAIVDPDHTSATHRTTRVTQDTSNQRTNNLPTHFALHQLTAKVQPISLVQCKKINK